jgi:hypothetical protein
MQDSAIIHKRKRKTALCNTIHMSHDFAVRPLSFSQIKILMNRSPRALFKRVTSSHLDPGKSCNSFSPFFLTVESSRVRRARGRRWPEAASYGQCWPVSGDLAHERLRKGLSWPATACYGSVMGVATTWRQDGTGNSAVWTGKGKTGAARAAVVGAWVDNAAADDMEERL